MALPAYMTPCRTWPTSSRWPSCRPSSPRRRDGASPLPCAGRTAWRCAWTALLAVDHGISRLQVPQRAEQAVAASQLDRRTILDDFSVAEHDDPVEIA